VKEIKAQWLDALSSAEQFVGSRPPEEAGCLSYARETNRFVHPTTADPADVVPHYGRPGGVLPRLIEEP
jgi:hypothetical protein